MKQYVKREFNEDGNLIGEDYYKDSRMTKLHRTDGPAMWYLDSDGDRVEEWYINDQCHNEKGYACTIARREGGTLIECYCDYYLNGECMSEDTWKKAIAALEAKRNPAPAPVVCKIDGKIVLIDGVKYTLTEVK